MEILVLSIGMVIGVFVGIVIGMSRMRIKAMGRLRIDHSEPDEPTRMFVELKGVTPDMIAHEKFVAFEVVNESYISHN